MSDITRSDLMSLVAYPVRWAASQESFPLHFRQQLAECAVRCSLAAWMWELGSGRGSTVALRFDAAVSIGLALGLHPDARILGREESPLQSRRGTVLSWRDACASLFDSVASHARGEFKDHVRAVRAALLQ